MPTPLQLTRLQVLVAVGGATFHGWAKMNAKAIANFVRTFGLDGVDIDYEETPSCTKDWGTGAQGLAWGCHGGYRFRCHCVVGCRGLSLRKLDATECTRCCHSQAVCTLLDCASQSPTGI
jgi:hypothetical protein